MGRSYVFRVGWHCSGFALFHLNAIKTNITRLAPLPLSLSLSTWKGDFPCSTVCYSTRSEVYVHIQILPPPQSGCMPFSGGSCLGTTPRQSKQNGIELYNDPLISSTTTSAYEYPFILLCCRWDYGGGALDCAKGNKRNW